MKSRLLILPLFASALLFGSQDLQNAGRTKFYFRSSSDFNNYTDNPSSSIKQWIDTNFWRFQSSSPYFDSRLSWMPNAWAYIDLYGIKASSSIVSQHPDWILKDSKGNRLYIPWGCGNGSCPNYAGDPSNSGFRSWWISNAKAIYAKGYKGFWIDDVNMEFRVANGNGDSVIPRDANTGTTMTFDNWRRYIAEFTELIRSGLPNAELVHNSIWFAAPNRYNDQYVIREIKAANYINCERGISDPGLIAGSGPWSVRAFLGFVDAVHSYGKNVLFDEYHYDGDYGLAGYYLISNGNDALGNQDATPDNWWSGYEHDLGTPLGNRYDWNNLIRRDFSDGMVLVNPPGTSAISVTLPMAMTRIEDGKLLTSLTLQSGQGVVLTGPLATPGYTISISPSSATVTPGSSAKVSGTIAASNGFGGTVSLAASGLPSGASASFSPSSISKSGSFTLTVATSTSTPTGSYSITVAATSGSTRHTVTLSLQVGSAASQGTSTTVSLSSVFNRSGAYTDGTSFSSGGLDGYGFAYSKTLLGSSKTLGGVTYNFGPSNAANGVVRAIATLPSGKYKTLHILATGVNGNQPSQQFNVTYTDNTIAAFTRSLSNWAGPAGYSGETVAMTMAYRNTYSGGSDHRNFYLYSYALTLDSTKTVKNINFPDTDDVIVLAVTLTQ